jgi:hypothetical protein
MTKQMEIIAIANSDALAKAELSQSIANPPQKRLVARWLVDENSKLYCQWIIEN